jgi:hypothetical protein
VNPQRISFARTLPILALLLSYVIIAVPATMAYINLKSASRHGSDVMIRSHKLRFRISHESFARASILGSAEITSHSVQAFNMPGFLLDLAVDRCSKSWPNEWTPRGLDFAQWRALSFPIFCLPFWWIAGSGLDGSLKRSRLSWLALLLGFSLWVAFLVTGLGLWFAARHDNPENIIFPFWGFGLWFVLLAAFPIAWMRQALARRRIRTSLHARLSAEMQ